LLAQLGAAGLPPRIVPIPYPCPNEIYEARIGEVVAGAVRDGVTHIIFGDLSSPISGPIANVLKVPLDLLVQEN
jgi:hypothetical protein